MKDYNSDITDSLKIIEWWCNGVGKIGGSLGLFLKMGVDRINELYNVEL